MVVFEDILFSPYFDTSTLVGLFNNPLPFQLCGLQADPLLCMHVPMQTTFTEMFALVMPVLVIPKRAVSLFTN